ncbi:MAG: aminodeoxychorismate synthase component I [Hydrogenophilaceae bacterium]|nr:aminodeoxychorismate synthase component I [Hydrogenophilaceae bacterium]
MKTLEWFGGQPDLLALKAAQPERFPALFTTGGHAGWDILFAFPQGTRILSHGASHIEASDFFAALPQPANLEHARPELPFRGGWVLMLGYELGGLFEPSAGCSPERESFPLAWAMRIPAAILVDRQKSHTWLVTEDGQESLLEAMAGAIRGCPTNRDESLAGFELHEEPPEIFLNGVERIKSYIREGDVFQVNLSRGWNAVFPKPFSTAALFNRQLLRNPAPFSALVDMGNWTISSSSPERLIRLEPGRRLLTRPIAGTHPRGDNAREDASLKARLASHPKEQAEHIMLVDLERNDLGRVCTPGSVKVEALMDLASYAHVHHLESTVSGRLRPDVTLHELVRAMFPGGTITGCPKVRTMQIIRELEKEPRRSYTGSLGYVNLDGTLDLNILIRGFLIRGNEAWFRTGAGIVADSDPQRELAETRAKAKGLLNALSEG